MTGHAVARAVEYGLIDLCAQLVALRPAAQRLRPLALATTRPPTGSHGPRHQDRSGLSAPCRRPRSAPRAWPLRGAEGGGRRMAPPSAWGRSVLSEMLPRAALACREGSAGPGPA